MAGLGEVAENQMYIERAWVMSSKGYRKNRALPIQDTLTVKQTDLSYSDARMLTEEEKKIAKAEESNVYGERGQ